MKALGGVALEQALGAELRELLSGIAWLRPWQVEHVAETPDAGDDFPAEVECRKTALVTTRTKHTCFGIGAGKQHEIAPGTRVYKETGKCEGKFGSCYMCLPCVDICLEPEWW
jgi:hypothetical protein